MGFKVLTLDLQALKELGRQLQLKIDNSMFVPDLVIGIPNGGVRIAVNVFDKYPHASMKLVRAPKGGFKRRLSSFIKLLPLFMRDWFRILEAHILVRKVGHMSNTQIVFPEMDGNVKRVLFVDDAVDSGATLKAVMDSFSRQYPSIQAKSAVITITGANTSYRPDYYLFDNRTLIRLPWSIDMK